MDLRQVFKMVKVLVTRRDNNYDENVNRFARRNSEGERWHCRIFIIGGSFFLSLGHPSFVKSLLSSRLAIQHV